MPEPVVLAEFEGIHGGEAPLRTPSILAGAVNRKPHRLVSVGDSSARTLRHRPPFEVKIEKIIDRSSLFNLLMLSSAKLIRGAFGYGGAPIALRLPPT